MTDDIHTHPKPAEKPKLPPPHASSREVVEREMREAREALQKGKK